MQQLDESFRDKDIFDNLSYRFKLWEQKIFLTFLVDILHLDPDP